MGKIVELDKAKNRKLKDGDLQKYVHAPDVSFYGVYICDGQDIELCDDKEEYFEEDVVEGQEPKLEQSLIIKDVIKDGILYKDRELIDYTKGVKEVRHSEIKIRAGEKLVYVKFEGFVKTKTPLLNIDQAIERYELLKSPVE